MPQLGKHGIRADDQERWTTAAAIERVEQEFRLYVKNHV
jgi:hypothetical protein